MTAKQMTTQDFYSKLGEISFGDNKVQITMAELFFIRQALFSDMLASEKKFPYIAEELHRIWEMLKPFTE